MTPENNHVVVIGAGICGLSAAYFLKQAGKKVTLVDPNTPGGMISTVMQAGFTLECGPNVIVERGELKQLIYDLGLSGRLRYPRLRAYKQAVWANGKVQIVPKKVIAFLCSSLFTVGEKIKVVKNLFRKNALKPKASDESVETFFSRLMGRDAARRVLDPVLKGIYGGDVAQLSARTLFSGLWLSAEQGKSVWDYLRNRPRTVGGAPQICVLQGGISVLTDALVIQLSGSTSFVRDSVTAIHANEKAFQIEIPGGTIECDQVLVTTSSFTNQKITFPASLPLVLESASLVVVHMHAPALPASLNNTFGVLFPAGTPNSFLGAMFNSEIFPHVSPSGECLLTLMFGGVGGDAVLGKSDQEFFHLAQQALELLKIRDAEGLRVTRWPQAIPQLKPGHHLYIEKIRTIEKNCPGLFFVGTDNGGIGVSDRVRMAHEVCKRIDLT